MPAFTQLGAAVRAFLEEAVGEQAAATKYLRMSIPLVLVKNRFQEPDFQILWVYRRCWRVARSTS
ncbi:hypothetical protein N9S81_00545, partial [bacterium]|nr:hypothetical protein [bacterium]